jgi:hypothetical protein
MQILLAHMGQHEGAEGPDAAGEGFIEFDLFGDQRLDALLIGFFEDRHHDEGGQEQRQRDHDRVGWCGLQADGGSEQRQHDHDPGEGRDHHQNRWRQRQNGDQRDQLQRAFVQPCPFTEIERDFLRERRRGGNNENRRCDGARDRKGASVATRRRNSQILCIV